jgi:hypothetical protein
MAGEEALNDFEELARHRGTPDYGPLLRLADELLDGGMRIEIEMDLEELCWDEPDELDEWAADGFTEYGARLSRDPGTMREGTHGGPVWVAFEGAGDEDDELPALTV